MYSRTPRLLVLAAALTTTACASSPPPVSALPRPLPAELQQRCPPPVEAPDNDPANALLALKQLYDQYGVCAGRLVDLVNWLQKKEITSE